MDIKRPQAVALALACLGVWIGCSGQSPDDLLGSGDASALRILEATYESETGAVLVRWEYRGSEPIEAFMVLRAVGAALDTAGVVSGRNALDSDRVGSFRDTDPVSGERIAYRVTAEGAGGRLAESDPATVKVAGAQMQGVSPDFGIGAVQIYWRGNADGVVAHEVVRQADGASEVVVHRAGDARETSFIDWDIRGDVTYTYFIRTVMSNGVRLKSRQEAARLYALRAQAVIEPLSAPGDRLLAFTYPRPSSSWLPMLVTHVEGGGLQAHRRIIDFQVLKNQGDVPAAAVESRPVAVGPLSPPSLSAIGPASLQGALGPIEMLLAGIDPETGQVVLNGYSYQMEPIFSTQWQADPLATRTAMAMAVDGRLFLSAGRQLKAFDQNLTEVGSIAIGAGEPGDLAALRATFATPQGGVWAAFPDEGRLLRGEVALDGARIASVTWHEVALPAGARPVALMACNDDQVFVLDANNGQVLVFSSGGRKILYWPVPGQALEKGDLATDSASRRLVHVLDGTGRLFIYEP